MFTDPDRSDQLCASTHIDMTTKDWNTTSLVSQRYLLKDKAVWSDLNFRMNDDSVRMWNKQAAANVTVQRYICTRHSRPESVP